MGVWYLLVMVFILYPHNRVLIFIYSYSILGIFLSIYFFWTNYRCDTKEKLSGSFIRVEALLGISWAV